MTRMTGAQAYVKALEREKVTHIFGITGAALIPICDELLKSDIRYIGGVHEQGSAHMADGYARISRKAGIVQVTSGPGATNIVTGIATAQMDSSSVVAFTGQVPRSMVGTDAFQETDIIGVTASITKWNTQVRDPAKIPWAVKSAIHIATTGRKGAVVVDLPKDITTDVTDIEFPKEINFRGYNPRLVPEETELEWAATLLAKAKRPVIMAGGGVIAAGASNELMSLSEMLMAPVTTSLMGKGAIPSDHPMSLGLCGMHGRSEANFVVPEADVLLVIGARFSDRTTGALQGFAPNARIIHIDLDKSEIDKNVDSITRVVGDAKLSIQGLMRTIQFMRITKGKNGDWARKIEKFKNSCEVPIENTNITGPGVIKAIRGVLPRDAIVTTDVGQHQMWAAIHYDVYEPGTFITSGGLGTMGWGTPAAIGAKVAKPNVPVINIAGDGSFAMTENNLAISIDETLPITVVIFNNKMLGMVAQWQRLFMNNRYSAVHRNYSLDFVKLAESYGAEGIKVESMKDLETALRRSVGTDHTVIIDVPIDPEENVYPMIPPGMGLKDILIEG